MNYQNPNQNASDKTQSLIYMLAGILFVLVLLEKSMVQSPKASLPDWKELSRIPALQEEDIRALPSRAKEKMGLKNIGKEEYPIPLVEEPVPDWEKIALREIEEYYPDEEIPVLDSHSSSTSKEEYLNIYFLKFFGKDHKASSRLVKVPRILPTSKDPVLFILEELKAGPRPEEVRKGVLSALPEDFTYNNYSIKNGILYLDVGSSFEYGGGPQILMDRIDQLTYSLVGVSGIRGIHLTIERKKVTSIGGDGVPLPDILVKKERRVTTL